MIVLCILEIMVSILMILATCMVENKFKSIKIGLSIYTSKRSYKTKADIDFIDRIIGECKEIGIGKVRSTRCIVNKDLQKEYIGKFPYLLIFSLATKLIVLMWLILGVQFLVLLIMGIKTSTYGDFISIGVSFFITVVMFFYQLIKSIQGKKEILVDEITNYIENIYPKEQEKNVKKTKEMLDFKEIQAASHEEKLSIQNEKESLAQVKSPLKAEDIAKLLEKF